MIYFLVGLALVALAAFLTLRFNKAIRDKLNQLDPQVALDEAAAVVEPIVNTIEDVAADDAKPE